VTRPTPGRPHRRGVAQSLGGAARPAPRRSLAARMDDVDHGDTDPDTNTAVAPWWRSLTWPVIAGAVATAGMLASGVPVWRAVVIAVACGAALWSIVVSLSVARPEWPYDLPVDVHRAPTTWQVPGLVGAMESDVSFQQYLRPRLWSLAQQLLRRRGIDPDSERAAALIGPREYALLTGADTDSRRAMASVPVLCQVIARLAVAPDADSEPAIRNPALAGLAGRPARPARRTPQHPTEGPHR